jgi:hypothetical protein
VKNNGFYQNPNELLLIICKGVSKQKRVLPIITLKFLLTPGKPSDISGFTPFSTLKHAGQRKNIPACSTAMILHSIYFLLSLHEINSSW